MQLPRSRPRKVVRTLKGSSPKKEILSLIVHPHVIVLFVSKENNNDIIYSAILLPELTSSAILESIPERNQHCLRSVDSVRMLNVNNADNVD